MDLGAYMAGTIRRIMATAYLNVLDNPREVRFVARMQRTISKAERRRKAHLEKEGVAVPPFLIASIATTCNLQCKGCYARKNGIAATLAMKGSLLSLLNNGVPSFRRLPSWVSVFACLPEVNR